MRRRFFDLAFTPEVQAEQNRRGSFAAYADAARQAADEPQILSQSEIDFLTQRDSFYLATVSATGWPYVQHRGGPPGFVRRVDERTIGWAEFVGNRQYVSVGNLAANDKVAMIFMDYPNRRRLKILGRIRTIEADAGPDLASTLAVEGYKARLDRFVLVDVEASDWNCPQHIAPRFTLAEIRDLIAPLHARIADLEAQLAAREAEPR